MNLIWGQTSLPCDLDADIAAIVALETGKSAHPPFACGFVATVEGLFSLPSLIGLRQFGFPDHA